MTVVPRPIIVTMFSLTVATPESELVKLTGKPLLTIAFKLNGASSTCLSGREPKLIVCVIRFTVSNATTLVTLPPALVITTV